MNELEKLNQLIRDGIASPLGGKTTAVLSYAPYSHGGYVNKLSIQKYDIEITEAGIDIPQFIDKKMADLAYDDYQPIAYYFEAFYGNKLNKAQFINVNGDDSIYESVYNKQQTAWLIFDNEEGYELLTYSSGLRLVTLVIIAYKTDIIK